MRYKSVFYTEIDELKKEGINMTIKQKYDLWVNEPKMPDYLKEELLKWIILKWKKHLLKI